MAEIINMPKLGFDMAEGKLIRWVIPEGDNVSKGAVLAEIETDKATVEVESNASGVVLRHLVTEGTAVPVGEPIAVIGAAGEQVDLEAKTDTATQPAPPQPAPPSQAAVVEEQPPVKVETEEAETEGKLPAGVRASPLARRMAETEGVDLQAIQGSGPAGRVTKKDIESYLAQAPSVAAPVPGAAQPAKTTPPLPPLAQFSGEPVPDQTQTLSKLRKAIGRRMLDSKQQVPHFYVTYEYDTAALVALRQEVNALLPEEEKVSVNDFVVKAAALTLRQFPNLNAAYQGEQVLIHGQVNVGVAVAVEGGLLTVVCRDADLKPLRLISAEVKGMAARARLGKVRPEDIEGSTFSVSNLGMFAVEHFSAIINPPEAAILAVGSGA